MHIPKALLAAVVLAAFAGCGGDDENDSSTSSTAQATVTETVTAPPAATEQEPTTTEEEPTTPTAPPDDGVCQDGAGNNIELIGGDVTCDQAKDVADGYDQQGDRVQEVGEFVCEGGNAQTRPIIFTCTGPGGEFTVSDS